MNTVTYNARPDLENLRMTNGRTTVFVSVLALAASELAETNRQREFAVWFASRDQLYGHGMVGFDLSELPWSSDTFAVDRGYVLRVIHAAKARTGWGRLWYEPQGMERCLDQFQAMVEAFSIGHASESEDGPTAVRRSWCCARSIGCTSTTRAACSAMIVPRSPLGNNRNGAGRDRATSGFSSEIHYEAPGHDWYLRARINGVRTNQ
jgi:hypothetical protein